MADTAYENEPEITYDMVKEASDAAEIITLFFFIPLYHRRFAAGGDEDNVLYGEVHGGATRKK
jgi:hypothetical protein